MQTVIPPNPKEVIQGRKVARVVKRDRRIAKALPYFGLASEAVGIFVLAMSFIWTRLPNLLSLPMFYDEVIYLQYAREYMRDPARNLLISAERDGKPPLFIWALSWCWNILGNPLIGGRLLSVLGGAIGCIFVYMIGRRLFNGTVAFVGALLYIICPLLILYNRMAVHASWETAAGMGALYFSIAIAQRPRAMYALGLGAAIGLGMLIKQTALFYFGLAPLVVFMVRRRPDIMARLKQPQVGILRRFSLWWAGLRLPQMPKRLTDFATRYRHQQDERESTTIWKVTRDYHKQRRREDALNWRRWLYMAIVGFTGIALAGAAYAPLLTPPNAKEYLSSTDTSYALSFDEVIGLPLDLWRGNIAETWSWWQTYFSLPVLVLAIAAVVYALARAKRAQAEMVLLAWAILPLLAQILLARQHWFSRYITAFSPPLLILAALGLVRFSLWVARQGRERLNLPGTKVLAGVIGAALVLVAITPLFKLDDALLNHPNDAQLPAKDRWQYVEGWPSGYGVEDVVAYVRDLAAQDSLLLYIDQDNVTPEYYFLYHFDHLKSWIYYGRTDSVNWNTRNFAIERSTYYITTVQPDEVLRPYLKLAKTFPKPGGKSSLSIYHFVPPTTSEPQPGVGN